MIEVNDIIDHEDGSATITVTMDYDTLVMFARKGILAALIETVEKVIQQNKSEIKE